MPPPNQDLFRQLTKAIFAGKAIALPQGWSQPNEQFPDAFAAAERTVAPNPPSNLFREPTLNKYHVDAAREIGKKLEAYIDGICGAICQGIGIWASSASIAGVMINGPVGVLVPGSVVGMPLAPPVLGGGPMSTPQEMRYTTAIAGAFGSAWQAWHTGLTGTLTYPAFVAVPAPVAPPMPNVPVPLISFASSGEALLAPGPLKSAMVANFGDPTALHAADLFDAIAQAFAPVFMIYKSGTIVKNVLGTGPVPTFAPPFVPVGPVVGGLGTGPPGCLS